MIKDYFLDESGNSGDLAKPGPRMNFGHQEVFALVCLGVGNTSQLDEELTRIKKTYRVQAPELKSSSVRGKPSLIIDLADYVGQMGLPLLVEAVDKRFMIAANMVNTLVVRPVGACGLTSEVQWISNIMAEYIHAKAPAAVFEAFVGACDEPSGQSVARAFTSLLAWLQDSLHHAVACAQHQLAAHRVGLQFVRNRCTPDKAPICIGRSSTPISWRSRSRTSSRRWPKPTRRRRRRTRRCAWRAAASDGGAVAPCPNSCRGSRW